MLNSGIRKYAGSENNHPPHTYQVVVPEKKNNRKLDLSEHKKKQEQMCDKSSDYRGISKGI